MKRGKDKLWRTIKYAADLAIYAKCSCGFEYCCSSSVRKEDGSWSFVHFINPEKLYHYCPNCGAKKINYETEYTKVNDLPPYLR